jgi:CBS-domain-containing membrane protein
MKRKRIHHLLVTSVHGMLVGMVSNHDLLPYAHELESSIRQDRPPGTSAPV